MHEFRLDDYLARIGFRGSVEPNFATLAALHCQHVNAIPFEGLDPLVGLPVNLDLGALQRKLVRSRRGGYCFEQNILFKAALETIGFKVTGLTARVLWMSPPDSPLGPKTHMLLKVDLPDGPRLADVGFDCAELMAAEHVANQPSGRRIDRHGVRLRPHLQLRRSVGGIADDDHARGDPSPTPHRPIPGSRGSDRRT